MPTPLIIDTDPGVDDAVALVLALHSPEVELRAVTASFGNIDVEGTFRNARRIVALAGRSDVPVAAGAARPLVHRSPGWAAEWHGADGLGQRGAEFGEPPAGDPRSALALSADVLRSADEPVTIASIGPLTNTALLLAAHPELAERIGRIVVMGCGLAGGNVTAAAEFNIYIDPEAAAIVFGSDVIVRTVPLDLTGHVIAQPPHVEQLLVADTATSRFVAELLAHYGRIGTPAKVPALGALHDPCAVLAVTNPELFGLVPRRVDIELDGRHTRGMTVIDARPSVEAADQNALVGYSVDAPRVMRMIIDAAIDPQATG